MKNPRRGYRIVRHDEMLPLGPPPPKPPPNPEREKRLRELELYYLRAYGVLKR